MTPIFLGLGSNIDREANLSAALVELEGWLGGMRVSTIFECPSYGFAGPDFWNLAVAGFTPFGLQETAARLRELEFRFGRQPDAEKFSSRTLDIDLLRFGDLLGRFGAIELPRSDILSRDFVLAPLCELEPNWIHPVVGKRLSVLWARMSRGHSLRRAVFQWSDSLYAAET